MTSISMAGNSGCGVWVLTISKPVIYGNRIGNCGDSGIAFVGNSDVHHDNQQLSLQFLQQDQDQVGTAICFPTVCRFCPLDGCLFSCTGCYLVDLCPG